MHLSAIRSESTSYLNSSNLEDSVDMKTYVLIVAVLVVLVALPVSLSHQHDEVTDGSIAVNR